MKDRIVAVMEALHLNQKSFANFIGLPPATLNSILTGRTRPTLAVVEAIVNKIPTLSLEWLISGDGPMYKQGQNPAEGGDGINGESVAADGDTDNGLGMRQDNTGINDSARSESDAGGTVKAVKIVSEPRTVEREVVKYVDKPQRRVVRIAVFYDDKSCDFFVPEK